MTCYSLAEVQTHTCMVWKMHTRISLGYSSFLISLAQLLSTAEFYSALLRSKGSQAEKGTAMH